ncbi:hypothetical protein PIB30_002591 [Stylosanthes scabra]|uniref:Uncharacterized protein n=1 Tax=Stylosanthes scabra TaxID=79078 RepID=A0ABU6Z539_9FABA|nr:hypothetical protein [Stylosanthes scabra]
MLTQGFCNRGQKKITYRILRCRDLSILLRRFTTWVTTSHNLSEFPKRLELLKQSLSETLTQFYPLGGRIKDDLSIDCNDEGANFVVAKANCPISKILSKPDMYSLDKLTFLPISFFHGTSIGDHVTNIQVNVFDCGGIAIGLTISHRILDGDSLNTFLKETTWVTRRFLFTNSTLAALKAQISAKSSGIEESSYTCPNSFCLVVEVFHGRVEETMWNSKAFFGDPEHMAEHELSLEDELVSKLKSSIQKVDKNLVARIQSVEGSSIIEDGLRDLCSINQGLRHWRD